MGFELDDYPLSVSKRPEKALNSIYFRIALLKIVFILEFTVEYKLSYPKMNLFETEGLRILEK